MVKRSTLFLGMLLVIVFGNVTIVKAQNSACKTPYSDATATDQVEPDYPPDAKDLGIGNVTVLVQVTIAASGKLKSVTIYKSSNNSQIDREALRVARESKYAPKIINCHAIDSSYLFRVDFKSD